jgi:hypothetical protein
LRRAAFVLCALTALAVAAPAAPAKTPVTKLHVGDAFIVSGQTGSRKGQVKRAVGLVVVRGRWNNGKWFVLTTTHTDVNGNYKFRIRPSKHGVLQVLIVTPDRLDRRYVLRVS